MIEVIYSIVGIQIIIFLSVLMGIFTYNSAKEYFKSHYEGEIEKLKSKNIDLEIELGSYKDNE